MFDKYYNLIDKDKERIITALYTGNKHLDGITKYYFASSIKEPRIGEATFNNVVHHFDYALEEYSKTHSKVISLCENHTQQKELLDLNNIPVDIFKNYKDNVDNILQSYTDKNWSIDKKQTILISQLNTLADAFANEDTSEYKLALKLNSINKLDNRTTRFIKSILDLMANGGINQVTNDKYIVIEKLINLYQDMKQYLKSDDFKEKKNYLKNNTDAKKLLHKYISNIMNDEYEEAPLEKVKWLLFYLIYDGNKSDIFMIHSILGYKNDIAKKLYQKLFLKDHNTGKNDNFLHHTDILNITEDKLYEDSRLYQNIIDLMN
ncbi:hypothetical protein N5U17_06165 [Aliarcobacter butzleri]|uniref:hypothetical protein n=1 Tax=Aliarcobacter butzleri TaxID=28197 RepID=UPI0021B2005C|nr:hypothetical protein [Aliarcobacter butzleri]MCT7603814.1 hypothetical protein [Aliarcobacter butzleri]